MGIKERRERERQELRQSILLAAREITRTEGWEAISIRKVADRIEYSPPMIYQCFENKEALLLELCREGLRLLHRLLQAVAEVHANPTDRYWAMLEAYWTFAWQYADLFQVMHGQGAIRFTRPGFPAEVDPVVDLVHETVAALVVNGDPEYIEDQVHILWITISSMIGLSMAGRINGGPERGKRLVLQAAFHYLTSWQGGR